MKDFFNQLFEYSHQCNQKFAEVLIADEERATLKATNLFSHLINAHQIWNSRILLNQTPFEVWQVHSRSEYQSIDKMNFEDSLRVINSGDFAQVISYKTSTGVSFENTVQDILFHIINHSTYHRAQIATELKSTGLTPPGSDWIMYRR